MPSGSSAKGGSSSSGDSTGKSAGTGKSMTPSDASRIQSSGAKNLSAPTHQSRFDGRAQSSGANNPSK